MDSRSRPSFGDVGIAAFRSCAGSAEASLGPATGAHCFWGHIPKSRRAGRGFDKNAVALPAWEALGFGFVEVGTITARPQPGETPSRASFVCRSAVRSLTASASITRGVTLSRTACAGCGNPLAGPRIPVGINLGKSKVTPLDEAVSDYLLSFERLKPYGDYFVLNVSSPNTPGLRLLQDRKTLERTRPCGAIAPTEGTLRFSLKLPGPRVRRDREIVGLAEERQLAGFDRHEYHTRSQLGTRGATHLGRIVRSAIARPQHGDRPFHRKSHESASACGGRDHEPG
jgi:hypothetical protein